MNGKTYKNEKDALRLSQTESKLKLHHEADGWHLDMNYPLDLIRKAATKSVSTSTLGHTFISETVFEHPDGTPFVLDKDFFGEPRDLNRPMAGPFEKGVSKVIFK